MESRDSGPFEHLAGRELPEGAFTITREEELRLAEALDSPPDASHPHPVWAFIATQRGIGLEVDELCALADFDIADGPMLGSVELTYARPLELDTAYRVTGEIVGVERKQGRRTGVFDVLTFSERLVTPHGEVIATSTSRFILPRREGT
jgi:hypothetical protein